MTVDASRCRAFFIRRMKTRMFWLSARLRICCWKRSAAPKNSSPSTWMIEICGWWRWAGSLQLDKVAALVERVFDEGGVARLLQEKGEGNPDADIDGSVELEEEAGSQSDDKDDQVRGRRPAGDADLVPVDHLESDPDEVGGQRRDGYEIEDRRDESEYGQDNDAAHAWRRAGSRRRSGN